MSRLTVLLLSVLAMIASADARYLCLWWDVKQGLDPKNMKVITINGESSGPTINAQQGDVIIAQVANNLEEDLAIRWQNVKQIGTRPCNKANAFILAGGTCAYRLRADQAGKFSYQSKFKMQGDAGFNGLIVVKEAS